jgi:hypothetical protein
MKITTWFYVGAVVLLLMAAGGICVGGFLLLGANGGAQGVTGLGTGGQETAQNVTLQVDLPGDTKIEQMKCRSCGGSLTSDNIKLVNGAPIVTCPYCNSVYQLTEEPKW